MAPGPSCSHSSRQLRTEGAGPRAANGRQRPPTAANGRQRPPTAANGRQRPPTAANGRQRPPTAANGRQRPPTAANGRQRPPTAANGRQRPPVRPCGRPQRAPAARERRRPRPAPLPPLSAAGPPRGRVPASPRGLRQPPPAGAGLCPSRGRLGRGCPFGAAAGRAAVRPRRVPSPGAALSPRWRPPAGQNTRGSCAWRQEPGASPLCAALGGCSAARDAARGGRAASLVAAHRAAFLAGMAAPPAERSCDSGAARTPLLPARH
ncbi:proline-rich protein 2-like [Anser cygnoides]|uniref:proline-rich protein 2-like n=1 Tax=Anser cygnoides TaxID=8845 RepID=UPI0034D27B1F